MTHLAPSRGAARIYALNIHASQTARRTEGLVCASNSQNVSLTTRYFYSISISNIIATAFHR